jgi:hypothetical protein
MLKASAYPKTAFGYELTGASLFFRRQDKPVPAHAVSCFIQGGRYFMYDSERPYNRQPLNWNNPSQLPEIMEFLYGKIKFVAFSFLVYTKKDFTNKIAPSCRRVYQPLTAENKARVATQNNLGIQMGELLLGNNNTTYLHREHRMTPALRAAIVKQYGKTLILGAETFRTILNSTNSWSSGMAVLKTLVKEGFRYNTKGSNFLNFKRKLLTKFPRPAPTRFYNKARNSKLTNKNSILKNLEKTAFANNYTINKNSQKYKNLVAHLNRRATLRSAAKAR